MFTRRKRSYRAFVYSALVITLCALTAVLLWPKDAPEEDISVGAQSGISGGGAEGDGTRDKEQSGISDVGSKIDDMLEKETPDENGDAPVVDGENETYYLLKKQGDGIAVFFCDGEGSEIRLETTDILYELLPPEDQQAFDEGIKADTQEELSALLQDFES